MVLHWLPTSWLSSGLIYIHQEEPLVGEKAVNAEVRATLYDGEELVCEMCKIDTERERERQKKYVIFQKAIVTNYNKTTITSTKGYKVTL